MTDSSGPLLAVDGTPLKRKLAQSLFRSRARAFGLALPLLAFIIVVFSFFATTKSATKADAISSVGAVLPSQSTMASDVAGMSVANRAS